MAYEKETLVTTTQDQLEDIKRILYDIRTLLIDMSMGSKANALEYVGNGKPEDLLIGEIPRRAANALEAKGYKTFGDLTKLDSPGLAELCGIGPVSFHKIVRAMELRGLELKD